MAVPVSPELNHPDTALAPLTSPFRADPSLRPDEDAGPHTMRLPYRRTAAWGLALAHPLDELKRTRTDLPGTQLRLGQETLSDNESCPTSSKPHPGRSQATNPSLQRK